jgi:cell wall-associated NlpC family hydrolase
MKPYSQNADDYISPNDPNYSKPLVSAEYQEQQLKQFYNHYYASNPQGLSPWNGELVKLIIPFVKNSQPSTLDSFNNINKSEKEKHYAENYKEQSQSWWNKIKDRMDLPKIASIAYKPENRAIAVKNTHLRALPNLAPDFYSLTVAGQGFPFDNLQVSSVWAGTPLYVFSLSKDQGWALVLTPDSYFAWVRSDDIAYVTPEFIKKWQTTAQQGIAATTETEASIFDENKKFELTAYIGSVYPIIKHNHEHIYILIPAKGKNNEAIIKTGVISSKSASRMPLSATPEHFTNIINQLKERPYGWGGKFFLNDCSQEMKSLFTPFGIWLPRNSAHQAQLNSTLDLSKNTENDRINLLMEKGHPLMTTIYVGGHIILYVGKTNMGGNLIAPITYQNLWGLSPKNRDKRYVIGHSVFLPILETYPQYPDLVSHAGESDFKLIFIDQIDTNPESIESFVNRFIKLEKYD